MEMAEEEDKSLRPLRKRIAVSGATLVLDYPVSKKTANIRKARKEIPVLISLGEQMRQDLSQIASASDTIHKESRASLDGFCSYVWKTESNLGEAEWNKIEQITTQPKEVARTNKSRTKEGMYDLFTGRIMTKKDQKFFGFGDKLEASYLSKKKSEKRVEIKRENCLDKMKAKTLETVMSPNPSQLRLGMSQVDRNGDMEFLQLVSKDMDPLVFEEEGETYEEHEGEYDYEEYEGEEYANLCTCVCACNCKAKMMWKEKRLTPEQAKKWSKRLSLAQDMYRLLRFVPPPSKHLRPGEELRGPGATILKQFLGKSDTL